MNGKCDAEYMQAFCERSRENALPVIEGLDWTECLPNHAPLIRYLSLDVHEAEGYKTPTAPHINMLMSKAGLDMNSHRSMDMREITIGESSEKSLRAFAEWVYANYHEDCEKFPSYVLSVDVEDIKIRNTDYKRLIDAHKEFREKGWKGKKEMSIFLDVPSYYAKNCHQLPARIILGNGITWFGSIRFPWYMEESLDKPHYKCNIVEIDNTDWEIIALSVGAWTGQNIIVDRNSVQDELYNLYGLTVKLPPALEIDALSVLAGWNFPKSDMFTTNLICNGGLLNKVVSYGDARWCLRLSELPESLLIYLIGDVRYGYITHQVLLNIIIRDLFPDPEICCATLEINQKQWIQYISLLLIDHLTETAVHSNEKTKAVTRKDLLFTLREFTESSGGRNMMSKPPESLRELAKLLPPWPTIVHGGPRYLHIVRQHFCIQYEVLKKLEFGHPLLKPVLDKEVDQKFMLKVNFQRPPLTNISNLPGTDGYGLVCWPPYKDTVFKITIFDLTTETLFKEANRINRPVQDGILEAIRLDPFLYTDIMIKIDADIDLDLYEYRFWNKCAFYDRMMISVQRTTGKNSTVCQKLEKLTIKKRNFVITEQMNAKSGPFREHFKEMCEVLANKTDGHARPRTSIQPDMYKESRGPNYRSHQKRKEKERRRKEEDKKATERAQHDETGFDLRDKCSRKRSVQTDSRRHSDAPRQTDFDLREKCSRRTTAPKVDDLGLRHGGQDYQPSRNTSHTFGESRTIRYVGSPSRAYKPTYQSRNASIPATVTSGAYEDDERRKRSLELDSWNESGIAPSDRDPKQFRSDKPPKNKRKKREMDYDLVIDVSPKGEGYFDDDDEDDFYHYSREKEAEDQLVFRALRESGHKFHH